MDMQLNEFYQIVSLFILYMHKRQLVYTHVKLSASAHDIVGYKNMAI